MVLEFIDANQRNAVMEAWPPAADLASRRRRLVHSRGDGLMLATQPWRGAQMQAVSRPFECQ